MAQSSLPPSAPLSSLRVAPDPRALLTRRLWRQTLAVVLGIYFFSVLYVIFLDGPFLFASFARSVATAGSVCLAISFSLSSLGYYFNAFDSKVVYRKYFGLTGYFLALLYSFLLLFLEPEFYFFGFFKNFWTPDISLGILAMSIFTMMALISNDRATRFLGPTRWRSLLRFGYVAYFLLVIRAIILESDLWGAWLMDPLSLPRVRLFLSILALFVIFFRLSLIYTQAREKKLATPLPSQSPSL